jgi:hypothetical protein
MISRRTLCLALAFGGASLGAMSRGAFAADEPVHFTWRVPVAHEQTVLESLRYEGTVTPERDTKGLPLAFIFAGVSMLPWLADAILTLRRKLVQPGIKIDTRGAEIKIEVDSTLPRGYILVVDAAGAKLYEPGEVASPAELVKVLGAGKGG